jgi:hypothetical protein
MKHTLQTLIVHRSTSVTVTETTYCPRQVWQVITLFLLQLKRRMFMFVQGPHCIGLSTAITTMILTTSWIKFFVNTTQSASKICVWPKNCIITELNRQQVKGHLPFYPQKYQSIVHWICLCCPAKITAALLIKRLITVMWHCCLGHWYSLLSDGILILVWTWYKYIKC